MTDVIVTKLEAAGLIETYETADGKIVYRLTKKGDQLGWLMALAGEDEAAVVLDALLADEDGPSDPCPAGQGAEDRGIRSQGTEMRRLAVALMAGCLLGGNAGMAMAQESPAPVGIGGRVEVPETGFAVAFPAEWVWYRTPVIDTQVILDTYDAVADPDFAEVFEEYVLFNEDDWLEEYMLFHEEDWFGDLVGISAHPSSGDDGGSPYDRCDATTLDYKSLDDYVDEQLYFWEEYGQELYPEGMVVTDVVLPAGEAVRMDTFESSDYAVVGEMGVVKIYCFGLDVPEDRWLSIAETIEFLPAEE